MFRLGVIRYPFYDVAGGTAGSGGAGAPPQGGVPEGSGNGGGSIIDLKPDTMVRIEGGKDPVKYGEYSKGFISQSEYTKKTQAHAAAVKAWEAEKEAATNKLIEEARKIAASRGGNSNTGTDPLQELRGQDYISGKTAAGILEAIQERGISPIVKAISERDEVIKEMHKHLVQQGELLKQMQQNSGMSALKTRLGKARSDLQLPDDPAALEFLEDLYASHEGEDWDANFDSTAKTKLEKLRKMFRAMDREQAAQARKKLIAGGGGNTVPGGKLSEGFKSPQQVADDFAVAIGIPD